MSSSETIDNHRWRCHCCDLEIQDATDERSQHKAPEAVWFNGHRIELGDGRPERGWNLSVDQLVWRDLLSNRYVSGPLSSSGNTKMNQKWLVLVVEEVGEAIWHHQTVGKDYPKEMWHFPQWLNTTEHCRDKRPRLPRDRLGKEAWLGLLSVKPLAKDDVSSRTHVIPSLHHGRLAASQSFRGIATDVVWASSSPRFLLTYVVLFNRHQRPAHCEITSPEARVIWTFPIKDSFLQTTNAWSFEMWIIL